jgi:hypothetical protein
MRSIAAGTWVLAVSLTFAMAQTSPQDQIGYKSDPNAEERNASQRLQPVSMLHAGHHDVQLAGDRRITT